jgi:hypothetical protein
VTEVTYWAYDALGNRSADGQATVRIDTVAPAIAIASPALAAGVTEVVLGSKVRLDLDCSDLTSGVHSCGLVGAASTDLPTGTLGEQSVTAFAVDVAGNRTEVQYSYRVVAAAAEEPEDPADPADPVVRPTGSGTGELAYTGVDVSGLALVGGLLIGAGGAAAWGRRLFAR